MRAPRGALAIAAAALLALAGAPGALASASDPDPSFGSSGLTLTPAGDGASGAGVTRLDNGSLVVAGTATGSGSTTVTVLARYGADGRLDTSFGSSGLATLPQFGGRDFVAAAVAARPGTGGDLILAGTLEAPGSASGDFAVVAVHASDGSLDTGFGSGGLVDIPIGDGGSAIAEALAVDGSSGELIVGGAAGDGGTNAFALAALNSNGTPLSTFGTSGKVLTPIAGGDAQINALALDGSSVIAAGVAQSSAVAAVARYASDGGLDPTFAGGAPVTLSAPGGGAATASAVTVQADQTIVIGGLDALAGGDCLAVTALKAGGGIDTSYGGGDGHADVCAGILSSATALVPSPDGLYAAGYEVDDSGDTRVMLVRLTSAGAPDQTFAAGGYVLQSPNGAGADAQANAILLDADQPVIAGEAAATPAPNADFMVERFKGGTPPASTSAPTVGGPAAPKVGDTLTAGPGAWSGTQPISYTYTWLRCPQASPDGCATAQTGASASYTLTGADGGKHIVLEVVAANIADTASADSAATAAVIAPPASITAPAISGTTAAGQTLTASPGSWSGSEPLTFTYSWLSCPGSAETGCSTVQSGASATYAPQRSDVRRYLRVTVTAANVAGSASANSSFTAAVGAGNLQLPQLTGCGKHVIIGPLQASGCFKQVGKTWVATGEVSINGVYLLPDAAGAKVVFDPHALTVSAVGGWSLQIGPVFLGKRQFGPWLVYKGKFKWDFSAQGLPKLTLPKLLPAHIVLPAPFNASLPAISLPKLPSLKFLGFPVVGAPTLKPAGGGVTLTLPLALPKAFGGITGSVALHADETSGLTFDGLHVGVPDLMIGPLELKGTDLSFQPVGDVWQASTSLVLPTPNHNAIGGSIAFSGGHLTSLSAHLDGAEIPIGPGAFLQGLSGSVALSPLHIGGSVKITAGPTIAGKTAATIDGGLTYDLSDQSSKLEVTGTLSVLGVKLANAALDYLVEHGTWSLSFTGQLGYVYTIHGPLGFSASIGASGKVEGDIYGDRDFYFDAAAQVTAPLMPTASGEVRANRKAMAACASIGGGGWRTLAGGFVYPWGGHPQLFTGCDLGPYVSSSHAGTAGAAAASRSVLLPRGLPMAAIKVLGAGGPPIVVLRGPGHARVTVPSTGIGIKTDRYLIYRDPEDGATYILVSHPAAGRWSVTAVSGSPAIAGVQSAEGLPAPRVRAAVTAHRGRRRLRYTVTPLPGQLVRFVERGHGVARVLGIAHGARGSIAIAPGGPAGRRTVVAEVLEEGTPRATIPVARYRAPAGRGTLPAPGRLRVARRGERVAVSFGRVRGAARYLVRVHSSTGATTQSLLAPTLPRLSLGDVVASARLSVTVRAIDATGAQGRPSRAVLAPQRNRRASHAPTRVRPHQHRHRHRHRS